MGIKLLIYCFYKIDVGNFTIEMNYFFFF